MTTTATPSVPAIGTWNIDPAHTTVEFVARHMVVSKVKGRFSEFGGTIVVAEDPTASSVEVTIEAGSVDTRDEKRDAHLRSPDFFDVDNYKQLTFASTSIQQDGNQWKLTGDLTIKDVTKPVTLDLEYLGGGTNPFGNVVAGFEASTEINRKDFGLGWNVALEAGGVLVGDNIQINIDLQAHLQQ